MAQVTVLLPDADSSKEVTFNASGWETWPARAPEGTWVWSPQCPADGRPVAQHLRLFAGKRKIAEFPALTWLGVYYTAKKADPDDRRW